MSQEADVNTEPSEKGPDGRDLKTGRFLPGWKGGPGRPRRIDFWHTVSTKAKEKGIDLAEAVWEVFDGLMVAAKKGDVSAAKLLLERVCEPDAVEVVGDLDRQRALREFVEMERDIAAGDPNATPQNLAAPSESEEP